MRKKKQEKNTVYTTFIPRYIFKKYFNFNLRKNWFKNFKWLGGKLNKNKNNYKLIKK